MTGASNPVDFFHTRFSEVGSTERAEGERRYMKSALRFHGVTAAQVREAVRGWPPTGEPPDREALHAAVEALFATEWFDLRSAAVGLLERHRRVLEPGDLPWTASLARRAANWAHVDWLATKTVAFVVARTEDPGPLLRHWAADEDVWVRRTALLALLPDLRSGGGDFALFESLAVPMLDEKVFWIRKAVGWVLRDVSRKRPELTAGFVRRHRERMSGLTLREAQRRLPPELRDG